MRTFLIYFSLVLLSASFMSCEEEIEKELDPEIISSVEFNNLKIGDIMLYAYQTGVASLESGENTVAYTGDTLELKVIEEIDGKFLIQERITPGSAIFSSDDKYIWGEIEEPFQFLWEIREDSVITSKHGPEDFLRGHLISGPYWFSVEETTGIEVEFDEWRTTLPDSYNTTQFFIKNGELNGITYPHLNATVNFGPMESDGDGYIFVYNKEKGIVRSSSISAWTSTVRGWDRIN